ncbi:hypothetical protein ABT061_36065 [Streptosporangium sp. NPDC002544]|uniref:hypothetical protein n=1 Tax=Streptosporangium sp. NPDC002544 TaxID=3154538 RepID=UPI00332A413F
MTASSSFPTSLGMPRRFVPARRESGHGFTAALSAALSAAPSAALSAEGRGRRSQVGHERHEDDGIEAAC